MLVLKETVQSSHFTWENRGSDWAGWALSVRLSGLDAWKTHILNLFLISYFPSPYPECSLFLCLSFSSPLREGNLILPYPVQVLATTHIRVHRQTPRALSRERQTLWDMYLGTLKCWEFDDSHVSMVPTQWYLGIWKGIQYIIRKKVQKQTEHIA